MTTNAADDFATIAQRLREIREEKERARQQQEQQQGAASFQTAPHAKIDKAAEADDDEFLGLLGYAG